ncbi:MAG: hypothetical protein ACOY5R_21895 [Pseudomonadota bacterium]|uniref:hypothetical protein n=1 Tax=Rhizorhabdus phycosphaerae TaxID=2711156 RepID=UPI0013E9BF16|nr:hypothetical protein [Rhizorhabdus phycosphaerae]
MIEIFESRLSYLERRVEQERLAAARASSDEARAIRSGLARRYEREARRLCDG